MRTLRILANRFVMAFSLLTRLPAGQGDLPSENEIARSAIFFPTVGIAIGLLMAVSDAVSARALGPWFSAIVALFVEFLLTGGMHIDGLMDTADGMMSGRTRERTIEIMHDSRVGPMGAASCVFMIAAKIALIASTSGSVRWMSLVFSPAMSRLALVWAFTAFPPVTPGQGMGSLFAKRVGLGEAGVASAYIVALCYVAAGPISIAVTAGAVGAALIVGCRISVFLGGVNGDVYGTLCEIAELASLAIFAQSGLTWANLG
ncbi:MAG: adenosylcobinamide-GDP ribazoletransferase [Clostridia bacterium]|nr:adenosylcobinamide-GDP ribazoletransferase [Clostridia bacterium]